MKIKTSITLLVGIILLVLFVTLIFSLVSINRLQNNLKVQVHTNTVIFELKDNLTFLLDAETGARGFVITSDTSYLHPYYLALPKIAVNTNQLRELTQDNPIQQKNQDTLEKLIRQKLARLATGILLKKQADEKAKPVIHSSHEGNSIMEKIRVLNNSMQAEEVALDEKRTSNTKQSVENTQTLFIVEGLFSILTTVFLAFMIFRELARRKQTEKELANSSERFLKIFAENPIAMSLSEIGTSKIRYANERYYKYFGYSEEEVIGHTSHELKLTSPEEDARLAPILLGYLSERRSIAELQKLSKEETAQLLTGLKKAMGDKGLDVLYTRKNGETFNALLSYDLIELDGKKYAVTSYMDISEQKEAENKIIAYSTELERKNKEIEQFAYVASHDLQEPLRSITNFSTLLTEKLELYPDNETREYVGYLNGGAKRMSSIIFDLLEYSRIGNTASKVPIDTDKLLKEILIDMSAGIKESGTEIHVQKLPVVQGYTYLKSVFQNLISNAIKFKDKERQPVVTISAKDNGKEFQFSVQDNGIGIEEIYYERIFLIFQRLHTRAEYEGTGIGLAHCKKIIELHGGKIWVESDIGKGSTFYFTLPKT